MLTKNDVLNWLTAHPVATLATVSPTNVPELSTVYTYVDDSFHCYFITKESTRKYQDILQTATVALSWFDVVDPVTCDMTGEASVVLVGEDVATAVAQLQTIVSEQKSGYWIPPVGQIDDSEYVVVRVIPAIVRYADYSMAVELDPHPQLLEFTP